jgi:hypothetical protein
MFEYANDELAPFGVRLVMIGQWCFDGPAHGVGVHQESDRMSLFYISWEHIFMISFADTSTFFSVNPEGHFVV